MAQFNSPLEIFKLLEKSNCRECGQATCLAFAGLVFKGDKKLNMCPRLDPETAAQYGDATSTRQAVDSDAEKDFRRLKAKISEVDLEEAARRISAEYKQGWLTVKVMGKNVRVNNNGEMKADIHLHPWLAVPVLDYIMNSRGLPLKGEWVPFRELKGGQPWAGLFSQTSEMRIKKVADEHPDFFEDMVSIFSAKQVESQLDSDLSLVMYPLPLVPILLCYWNPEDGLESELNVFFDSTAADNLPLQSVYALGAGMANMFLKIAITHGG